MNVEVTGLNIYDEEEFVENCTIIILTHIKTKEISWKWFREDEEIDDVTMVLMNDDMYKVEVHEDCTVHILTNTFTRETSCAWFHGGIEDMPTGYNHE